MKPLEKIIFQKKDTVGVINMDAGMLFYDFHHEKNSGFYKEVLNWVQIDYEKRCEIYLSLDDYDKPPYRNILVCGVGSTVEQARSAAIRNLKKEMIKV